MALPPHVAEALEVLVAYIADRVAERSRRPEAANEPHPAIPKLLTKAELGAMFSLSSSTIDRLVRTNRIPFVWAGDSKRFDPVAVRASFENTKPTKLRAADSPHWASRRSRRS